MLAVPRPSSQPSRVGLLVFLVLVLTSSLLAAPWVAAGVDFGHWHPDDVPSHIHDISGILTGAVTAVLLTASLTQVAVSTLVVRPPAHYAERFLCLSRAIRAPPLLEIAVRGATR